MSIFLLATIAVQSQQSDKSLQDRVTEISEIFKTDPDKAFKSTTILLEEAIKYKDRHSELSLLSLQCSYYHFTSDIDNLIRSALNLQEKAVKYKNRHLEANAHIYLLAAYEINQLYDKSLSEFDKAISILEKENQTDYRTIREKIRAYTYIANLYNSKKEHQKAIQYLLIGSKELEKLKDSDKKRAEQYKNYSAIALSYLDIDTDSAEYYLKKSMALKPDLGLGNDHIAFLNNTTMGDILLMKEKYTESITYYYQAEEMLKENSNSNIMNRGALYRRLQIAYEVLSDTIKANYYENKIKEIDLKISQQKYKSLHKILEDSSNHDNRKTYYIIAVISFIFLCSTGVFIYRLKKKNKLLQEQEKKSQEYLDTQIPPNNREESFRDLIEMVQNNDPEFMSEFLKVFPYFEDKLREISPDVREVDIELSAFLKLNLPTKEIAKYKDLSPRAIHNRKHRLRKKLNIPENTEIYYWFGLF